MDVKERIRGGLLALACGDALGAPAEYLFRDEVRRRWGRLRDLVGGGPWAPGEPTDDTDMTLCMLEGILADPTDPVPATGRRFLAWAETAKDVGTTVAAALAAFRRCGRWDQAARETPQARSRQAAGNGSLMRTLPVALAYPDAREMAVQTARLSAMTHWDPQAEACCILYCYWIHRLLHGAGLRAAWHDALSWFESFSREPLRRATDTPGLAPLPTGFWRRLRGVEHLTVADVQPSGYAGYVVECLEAAVWCCLHAPNLEEALVTAVHLGGEADTIAAVAGGAVGVYFGCGAIPERWLDVIWHREQLLALADAVAGRWDQRAV